VSLCRASRVCCRRGVKILPREPTTLLFLLPKSRCFQKLTHNCPLATHHTELQVQTIKIQAIAKYARHLGPPPLEHDGVTSRRAGAIPQRHAHAPLAGLHQPRVAHGRDTISVLGPSREARDCVRVCEAVPNIYAGPSTRALASARLAC